MQSGSDMITQLTDAVMPGLEGIQVDMMTLLTFFLGIALLIVGAMVVISILAGRARDEEHYISDGEEIEGSEKGYYSGKRVPGLIPSNRYED